MRRTLQVAVTALLFVLAEDRAEAAPDDPGAPSTVEVIRAPTATSGDGAGDVLVAETLEARYADLRTPAWPPVSAEAGLNATGRPPRCYRKRGLGLEWSAGLYFWLPSASATSYGDGTRTEIDIPFEDILDSTNFGVLGVLRAKRGPWWAEVDVVYGNLGNDVGRVVDEAFLTVDADIGIEQWQVDLMVGYDFLRLPTRVSSPYDRCERRLVELGVFAGARWGRTKIDATIEGSILGQPIGSTISETETDVHPFGGLWLRLPLTSRWSFEARGRVGGWDGFRWQAQAFVSYQLARQWAVFGGWRAEGTDDTTGSGASRDGLGLDINGPILGIGFGW